MKLALMIVLIQDSPNQDLPFEIMSDALDYAIGVILRKRIDKRPTTIFYASKMLSND